MAESTPALAGTETVTELHQTSHLEHKLEYDSIFVFRALGDGQISG